MECFDLLLSRNNYLQTLLIHNFFYTIHSLQTEWICRYHTTYHIHQILWLLDIGCFLLNARSPFFSFRLGLGLLCFQCLIFFWYRFFICFKTCCWSKASLWAFEIFLSLVVAVSLLDPSSMGPLSISLFLAALETNLLDVEVWIRSKPPG